MVHKDVGGELKQHIQPLTLQPGQPATWKTLEFALIGASIPPLPIVGRKFITDSKKTVIVEASYSGQPVVGTIGQLQCSNRKNAEDFNCFFPSNICNCDSAGDDQVKCICEQLAVEKLFEDDEQLLPLSMQGITINGKGKDVTAHLNAIAGVEVQITTHNMTMMYMVDITHCYIKVEQFSGCYSCLAGAKLSYECTTDEGEALAQITCNTIKFSANCDKAGRKQTSTLVFHSENVDEVCKVRCLSGETSFHIKGTLMFIDKNRVTEVVSVGDGTVVANEGFLGINWPNLDWFSSNWKRIIFAVFIGILIFILILKILPVIVNKAVTTYSTCIAKFKNISFKPKQHGN